jgi:RNA polymerase-binding transcription factor DksA
MTARNALAGDLVEEIRRRLAQARRDIYATVATTDEELATLETHQPGSPPEDAATETASAILSRLEGREKHELDEIDAAQARLAAGTYGSCEGCRRASGGYCSRRTSRTPPRSPSMKVSATGRSHASPATMVQGCTRGGWKRLDATGRSPQSSLI